MLSGAPGLAEQRFARVSTRWRKEEEKELDAAGEGQEERGKLRGHSTRWYPLANSRWPDLTNA